MKFPEGIEGDYIETKKNSLIFDVKGLLHPRDRKISFIRFYPSENGDRIRNNLRYDKIYDLEKRYDFLEEYFPEYLFFSTNYDLKLQGVPINDIKKIYNPRDHFQKLKTGLLKSNSNDLLSMELCNHFLNKGDLNENDIGITGSTMVGLSKNNSDIDLIIYGTQKSLNFQKTLQEIYKSKKKEIRKYNIKELEKHFKFRAGGSGMSFNEFLRSEKGKLHQGKFHNEDFFIRYLQSPNDWEGTYYDYQYKNFGRIKMKATITNANDSIFTPCSYDIKIDKILDSNCSIAKNKITKINSYRGRFCEQAKNSDKVFVEGKLEKAIFKDSEVFYRILLGNQRRDKMIRLKT